MPDHALATAMEYESAEVIKLFQLDQMRVPFMPFKKVPSLAGALDTELGMLMRRVLVDAFYEQPSLVISGYQGLNLPTNIPSRIREFRTQMVMSVTY